MILGVLIGKRYFLKEFLGIISRRDKRSKGHFLNYLSKVS